MRKKQLPPLTPPKGENWYVLNPPFGGRGGYFGKVGMSFLIIFIFLLPSLLEGWGIGTVSACPLCQGGAGYSQETITAYKVVTGFLASLPMIMGLGIFWWIRKKTKNPS